MISKVVLAVKYNDGKSAEEEWRDRDWRGEHLKKRNLSNNINKFSNVMKI